MTYTFGGVLPMNERDRLAVLASLSWLLLLPAGWFLTYNPLARLTLFRTLLGLAYIAVALYRLVRWSAFFRKRDKTIIAFVLLWAYVVAFVAALIWLELSPPVHAGDWAIVFGLGVLGCLLVGVGALLVLAPRIADEFSQLSEAALFGGQVALARSEISSGRLRLGRRFSGAFLLTVGCLVLSVAVPVLLEIWRR